MSKKPKKFSASWRERKNRNDRKIFILDVDRRRAIAGQPPLAVDSVCLRDCPIDVGFAKQSRPDSLLSLARRVAEVLGCVLAALRYRASASVAARFPKPENWIVFCDG